MWYEVDRTLCLISAGFKASGALMYVLVMLWKASGAGAGDSGG